MTRTLRAAGHAILVAACGLLALIQGTAPALAPVLLLLAAAALAAVLGARSLLGSSFVLCWSHLPLALFVLLVLLQVLPLPSGLAGMLAPENARTWAALRDDLAAGGLEAASTAVRISLHPQATADAWRLLLALAFLHLFVVNCYRHGPEVKQILGWVAALGFATATLGIGHAVVGARLLPWLHEEIAPGAFPFAEPEHLAHFISLTIGAGLGLLVLRFGETKHKGRDDARQLLTDLDSPQRRPDLLLLVFLTVAIIAIALSRARHGVLSIGVAGACAAALLQATRFLRGIGWPLSLLALAAFLALDFLGFSSGLGQAGTDAGAQENAAPPAKLSRDPALAVARTHAPLGVGLGAGDVVLPRFETEVVPPPTRAAHDEYLALLDETGVAGGVLALGFLGLTLATTLRSVRRRKHSAESMPFGLVYGGVAVAFLAFSTPGLRVPAVAALVAVTLGLVAGRDPALVLSGRAAKLAGGGLGIAGAIVLLAQLPAAWSAWSADAKVREAKVLEPMLRSSDASARQVAQALRFQALELASSARPGDARLRLLAAQAQWDDALARLPDSRPSTRSSSPELARAARDVQRQLVQALSACPTLGPAWALLAEVTSRGALGGGGGAAGSGPSDGVGNGPSSHPSTGTDAWVRRARLLAPGDASTCVARGLRLLSAGDTELALRELALALQLGADPGHLLDLLVRELGRLDVARQVARGDLAALLALLDRDDSATVQADVRAEAKELLKQRSLKPNVPPWMLARLAKLSEADGDLQGAIRGWRRFLTFEPDSESRYELASLLARSGDPEGAKDELRRLLGASPDHLAGKKLLQELGGR